MAGKIPLPCSLEDKVSGTCLEVWSSSLLSTVSGGCRPGGTFLWDQLRQREHRYPRHWIHSPQHHSARMCRRQGSGKAARESRMDAYTFGVGAQRTDNPTEEKSGLWLAEKGGEKISSALKILTGMFRWRPRSFPKRPLWSRNLGCEHESCMASCHYSDRWAALIVSRC